MADPGCMLQRVIKLKNRLSHTQDTQKIMKALKGLQDLEISLDILVETGVGKTVNSFRRHDDVGNLAKSLISHWKKLVPQDNASAPSKRKHHIKNTKEISNRNIRTSSSKENNNSEKSQVSESVFKSISFPSDKQKKAPGLKEKQRDKDFGSFSKCKSRDQSKNMCKNSSGSQEMDSIKHICKETNERDKSLEKHSSSLGINKSSKKDHSSTASRKDSSFLKAEESGVNPSAKQTDTEPKTTLKLNSRSKSPVKSPSGDDFEPPTMSFESYLNYDQVLCRRKRKACPANGPVTNKKVYSASQRSVMSAADEKEGKKLKVKDCSETPSKKAKTSLQDLLNTPLPKVLPEISISSPPYASEFKAPPAVQVPEQRSETTPFTGRRLNSKMQVYSGSKTVYLSKMLTLYEQCIRVLQNNIDSLHEVGGVPFEILEPVLTRCTPEQLFRIEDCNPTFVEESGHLWKKHCQRDFRNEQLLEYESWREMYLRLFSQREEKLKSLTKSILSAQSEKPKGRQVKMAFIHGMAKPPRNIRRQQEIYGTAGPVVQLQSETKNEENRERSNASSGLSSNKTSNVASTSSSVYSNGPNQDVKKLTKRIAPMMRKSLRAFKNRVGPR
ncbi:elongin-A-like [Hemicordylus capensis]|uniref:elongin-A-like n=1 Tax=Hemicordylus capensis TaxID=884348 RepID=UPI002303EC62|nr:elongin-A-like [Hemicordylus capensis]